MFVINRETYTERDDNLLIRTSSVILDYYNAQIVNMISEKYGYSHQQSFNDFAKSEIHKMLSDSKYKMWEFGAPAIFDMWEAKKNNRRLVILSI